MNRVVSSEERDVELVRRIAAGDDDALRELYAAYGQRLYAYALRVTGDPATADDVLQETLVTAWRDARRFRGEGRVIAWLLGIVHHKALNALRGRPMASLEDDESMTEPPSQDPSPDEQAVASEQRGLLAAGLRQLSLEQRTVLELVFYQGLSLAEVAEVCRCPLGTVKSRLAYAKASLRGVLSQKGLSAKDIA